MKIEELFLSAREAADVDSTLRIDAHSLQRRTVSNRRDDKSPAVLKTYELRWLRSFGQFFRFDKWNVCQGQTAKRTGGKLCAP